MAYVKTGFGGFGVEESGWWPTDLNTPSGGWQADVVAELSNPQEAIAKGEALVKNLAAKGWDKAKTETYNYFYLQGRNILEQLEKNPTAQRLRAVGDASFNLIKGGQGILDANGTADRVAAIKNFGNGMVALVAAIDTEGSAAATVTGWVAAGVGCAASFASGPIGGAIGCAAGFIISVLKTVMTVPPRPTVPPGAAYALFAAVGSQQHAAQTDALRLATVLKFHYGVNSIAPISDYIQVLPYFRRDSGYPAAPDVQNGTFAAPSQPVPAVDPLALALIGSYIDSPSTDPRFALLDIQSALDVIAQQTCDNDWDQNACVGSWEGVVQIPGVAKLRDAYARFGDINVAAFEAGASIARGFISQGKAPILRDPGAPGAAGAWNPNFAGLLRIDELINYFVAVTLREIDDKTTNETDKTYRQYLAKDLPVRLYDAVDVAGYRYDKSCWTRLNKGCVPFRRPSDEPGSNFCLKSCSEDLLARVLVKDPLALREFALIRTMVAFSHLLVSYRWTRLTGSTPADLIAAVAVPPRGTPAWRFQAPVDPRQVVRNGDQWSILMPAPNAVLDDIQKIYIGNITNSRYFENRADVAPYTIAPDIPTATGALFIRHVTVPAYGVRYWQDSDSSARSIRTIAPLDGQLLARLIDAHEFSIRDAVQAAYSQAQADHVPMQLALTTVGGKTMLQRYQEAQKTTPVALTTVGGKTMLQKYQAAQKASPASTLLWIGAAIAALKFLK